MDKPPQSYSEWTDHGSKLLEQGRYKEALDASEEALHIRSEYASAWVIKARALQALDRPEEGLAACDRAIEHDKDSFDAYYYKGLILEGQEHWEQALTEFDRALRIDSESLEALCHKAEMLGTLQHENAPILPIATRMIRLNPQDSRGWRLKAMGLYFQRDYREAEEAINHALSLDSADKGTGALMLKASILEDTGRQKEARNMMNRAAELDPKDKFIQEVKAKLALYQMGENIPTLEEAKKSLVMCWVVTVIGGIVFMRFFFPPSIVTIPLSFYCAWSLYWGWAPVWRRWRNFS